MAQCPVCGSEFSNIAGAVIKVKQNTISVCYKCYDEWNTYGRLTEENGDRIVKLYNAWEKGLDQYCKKDEDKKVILDFMYGIYSKYRTEVEKKAEQQKKIQSFKKMLDESENNFLITSGYNFEGYKIKKYYTVTSASTVMGTGIVSELSASLSDTFGMTSNAFEKKMDAAKEISHRKLALKAHLMGANAIIGVDFDYLTLGSNMIAVSANGTPVIIEKEEE